MPCYYPNKGWSDPDQNGKWTYKQPKNDSAQRMTIACGQCLGCRTELSRQWAMRNMHEASLYADNSFLTLTYDNENLPPNGSLDKKAFPKFIRSLRQDQPKGKKIRYYACGEYGDNFNRPHYHAILYNYRPNDLIKIPNKKDLFTSPYLTKKWNKGFISIGNVTFQSAAYVSSYVTKKITGNKKYSHYGMVHPETGEYSKYNRTNEGYVLQYQPEFSLMSRKPGIGKEWFDKYYPDIYRTGETGIHDSNGKLQRPPRFYDNHFKKKHIDEMAAIREKREDYFFLNEDLFTPESLAAAKKKQQKRMSIYKRNKI
jgi:hypothetical protein